jgi:hypothetical protein
LGILAYIFWKEKTEDLTETQHGHLHDSLSDSIEHTHDHWHKDTGLHSHIHTRQKKIVTSLHVPIISKYVHLVSIG